MAVSRLSQTSLQNAFQKYNNTWDGRSAVGSMDAIGLVTVDTSSASVTFTSIPQTYTHLQLRGIASANYSAEDYGTLGVRFNSDTGSNYTRHMFRTKGNAASADGFASTTFAEGGLAYLYPSSSLTVATNVIDILDYTNTTKYTTVRGLGGIDWNGAGAIQLSSGVWQNTAAVTSLTLFQQNGNFYGTSSFALYGIK
jgi:hypothetical protein